MANSSRKNKHRRQDKRYGHKQARQATRHVLEDGGRPRMAHGAHWSPVIEQPPLSDEAILKPPKVKKNGCKRNGYGAHVIGIKKHYSVEVSGRRWYLGPSYECINCKKGFWLKPKNTKTQSIEFDPTCNWD